VDARSDVYGLGAILYELLSDRPPFRDETIYDLLVKVVTEDPKPLPPNVDRDLGTIAMKCLEKDRARRYAGANEVADDLDRWLRGDPISARPRSTFYKLRTFAARRAGVLAAVVVPLAAAAVLGILWLSQRREPAVFDPIRARLLSLPDTPEAWRRGLQLIDEGLARFDGSWDAWLRKGELHEKLGEIDAALDAFRKAYEANPRIAAAHYQRGRILMDVRQKNDDALREFEAALRVEEDNEYALVGRARIAMLRGQHPEVLSILDRVEPIGRHVEDMHFLRGIVHADRAYGRFDPAKAIASFSEAIRLGPRHAASWDNRGTARGMNGDHAGAVEDHTRAIELNPNFATAHQNRGIARRAAGDAEHAIADFTRAIELNPSLHKAFANRAVLRHERGDQEGALADGGRAIALNGAYALSFEARGAAREETGDGDGALADYARAIEIEPDNPRVFARRAALRMRTGDLPGAREDIERAIRCGEPYAGSFAIRGQLHGKTGNPQAAIADFTHAIELDPGAAAAYGLRAEARRATGDLDGALADCTEALARDPRMGAAYETRGLVHLAREQFEEAIAAFDRTIEFGQLVGMAHFHRGQARMRRGNAEGALADFDAAIRLEPRVPESYVSRGIWRAANGQASGAVTDFERALQVAPADWRHRKRVEEMLARARGK
jgi:tetratricopeptide (TPR) repeat protein